MNQTQIIRPTPPGASSPIFFFLHVPKTGGASLRQSLGRMFYPHFVIYTKGEDLKKNRLNLQKWNGPDFYRNYSLIGGHIPRVHPIVNPTKTARPRVYISLMRDPVKRVVSFYDYVRRRPAHVFRDYLMDKTLLEAFTEPSPFRQRCIQEQLQYVFGTSDEAEAERMLQEDNHILAPIEKMEEFVDAVAAVSGRPRPPRLPPRNVAKEAATGGVPMAHEQPGYEEALAAIAEANAPELRFMERHLKDVLVTGKAITAPFAA